MKQKIDNIALDGMHQAASQFSKLLKPGNVVFLEGALGAGKTTFIREVAENFGVIDQVTSPSFAIVNVYRCEQFSIAHFDLYRLSSSDDLEVIGGEEFLNDDHLVFVEWPDHGVDFFPAPDFTIKIEISEHGESRNIIIEKGGADDADAGS